jgi:hypothetical protein
MLSQFLFNRIRGLGGVALAAGLAAGLGAPRAELAAQNADPLLGMSPGARAAGLGRAASALAGEPDALSLNPASAAAESGWVQAARLSGGSLADVSANAVSIGAPLFGGSLVLALGYDDYGDIVRTGEEAGSTLGDVSLHDLALAVTYARPVAAGIVLGATTRYIRSERGVGGGSGAAVDLGAQLRRARPVPFALAASVRNLGQDLTFDLSAGPSAGETVDSSSEVSSFRIALPTRLRVGAAVGPLALASRGLDLRVTLAYDAESDLEGAEGLNHFAGLEALLGEVLALRAGALSQVNPFEHSRGREWGYTLGVGVSSRGWVVGVAREMELNSLGDQTHLSAGYRF